MLNIFYQFDIHKYHYDIHFSKKEKMPYGKGINILFFTMEM